MTQSGQGEPPREGIVLPSDGGEPVLPGMTGGPAQVPAAPTGQTPAAAPTGGQAWGRPWGPDQPQPHQPDQGWPPAAAQQWATQEQQPGDWNPQSAPAASGPGPLPPEGAPATYGGQAYGSADHGVQNAAYGSGAPQPQYGTDPHQQQYGQSGHGSVSAPLPPAVHGGPGVQSAPLPPADEGATQYIAPIPAAPAVEGATQYIPPVPAAGPAPGGVDEGATQYIPPVGPGAYPGQGTDQETRFLGQPVQPQPGGHSDADATQYIAPVAASYGGDRQPPSEFDNLFRSAAGEGPAGSTQQLPRVQEQPPSYGGPSYSPHDSYDDGGGSGRGRRTGSRVPVIAAIGVGLIVVGVCAGALLGGGDGDKGGDKNKTVAASAPATEGSASAAADPAKEQAVALDKLLASSGSSRASVIKAVADVKACDNLDTAASNLRDAAKQRSGLVTQLSKLSVDKLPSNAELTAALTKAWQASASADNHYAAWADQVGGGKRGCRKGQARGTGQTQAGNRASGVASAEKAKAAGLWNVIAQKYGLTQRQPTQL
ncbi:hypothetical protein [Streptomyces sp. NPDC054794]